MDHGLNFDNNLKTQTKNEKQYVYAYIEKQYWTKTLSLHKHGNMFENKHGMGLQPWLVDTRRWGY